MKIEKKLLEKMISIFGEEETASILTKDESKFFNDFCEKLWGVYYGDEKDADFFLFEKDYTDAINSRGVLHVTINDTEYICVVRDGNMDGSVVEEFSVNAEYEPPAQYKHSFELDEHWLHELHRDKRRLAIRLFIAKNEKIQIMCGKYIYDRFFSPTNKIEKHYRDYMKRNHLVLVSEKIARN